MKKSLLIFYLIIAIGFNLKAQVPTELATITPLESKKQVQKNSNKLYFLVRESFPLEKKGRKFLTNDFIKSTIIDFENEQFDVELRYRFLDDEMQMMHQGKIKAIFPQKVNKLIFTTNETKQIFIPTEYSDKKTINLGYFELLAEGDMKLLKQFQKSGKEKIKTVLFFQNKSEPAKRFKVKKSSILKLMSKHKSSVSKFIVKNKLNVKNEDDLKKVFEYYNSLP